MPYKTPIVCLKCEATESPLWTNAENLGVICLNCVNEVKKDNDDETEIKVINYKTFPNWLTVVNKITMI